VAVGARSVAVPRPNSCRGGGAADRRDRGLFLFIARAVEYAASGLFQAKMLLVALAVANALVFRRSGLHRGSAPPNRTSIIAARGTALVSLLCWPAAMLLGRLVGYF